MSTCSFIGILYYMQVVLSDIPTHPTPKPKILYETLLIIQELLIVHFSSVSDATLGLVPTQRE